MQNTKNYQTKCNTQILLASDSNKSSVAQVLCLLDYQEFLIHFASQFDTAWWQWCMFFCWQYS